MYYGKEKVIDKGSYLIVGDEVRFPRHMVNKSRVKSFKNNGEKWEYRKSLFESFKTHAHYGKWFDKKLHPILRSYIRDFLRITIEMDNNEFAVAVRNALLDGRIENKWGKSDLLIVDEMLSCIQTKIRIEEEGIVEIPFNLPQDQYENLIN